MPSSVHKGHKKEIPKNVQEKVKFLEEDHVSENKGKARVFFISWFTNPPTVIFRKVEKNIFSKIVFIFYPQAQNIICFVEKITYSTYFEVLAVFF